MNSIVHISTHYYPINGGQQIYIENFRKAFPQFKHYVVQLHADGVNYPDHVFTIKVPKGFSYRALSFFYFNFKLRCVLREMVNRGLINASDDLAFCHYAFHYNAVRSFKHRLILSHGVEWDGPGGLIRKTYHQFRRSVNARLIGDKTCVVVANDINYLRQLGVAALTEADAYTAVRPGKWLIPNSVDIDRFREKRLELPVFPTPAIVIPRNIVPQRGIDVVIKAFATLVANPSFEHCLYIVGAKYDTAYYARLVVLVEQLRLQERVVFFGPTPYERMCDVYNSADAVVIFSLFREGTSLAALEAMACGTPVITSDVGGLKDIPTIKATEGDLAQVINDTLADRQAIARRQRDLVRKTYTSTNWTAAWSMVLHQVERGEK